MAQLPTTSTKNRQRSGINRFRSKNPSFYTEFESLPMSRSAQFPGDDVGTAQNQLQYVSAVTEDGSASAFDKTVLDGGAMFIASSAGNGLNYLFSMGLARALGAFEFGLYAIGLTYFNVLTQITPLGTTTGVTKFVSESLALKDHGKAWETIKSAITITLFSSIIFGGILAAGARSISEHLYGKPELTTVLLLFAVVLPFAATASLLFNALLAFQATRAAITVKYVWEPVGKIVLASIMVFLGFHLVGVISAIGLVIAFGAYMAAKALKGKLLTLHAEMNYCWPRRLREFVLFCSPLAISNAFGVIAPRSDILILGYWVNTNEIGVYLACLQTAGIISLVLGSFETVFAPFIARVLALNNLAQLRAVYQSLSRLVILFTIPLWIVLSVLSSSILNLFGEAFREGWIPLVILTTGHLVSSMASSPNHVLLMGGHSKTVMLNTVVTGLLQIVVAILLIPHFGTVGAAIASAGGLLAITFARVVQVWRRYHVIPFSIHFIKPLVAGGAMAGAMLVVAHLLKPSLQGLEIPLVCVVGLFTYLGCQLALGLDPVDKSLLREITKHVMARVNLSSRG